jgi:LPXTG-motif cell wall-anchored protein
LKEEAIVDRWIRYALLLVSLTVLITLPGLATADGSAVMRAIAPNESIPAGQTFEVRITLEGAQNLGAFQFTLIYDPAIVRFDTVRLEGFLGSTGRAANALGPREDEGRIMFGAFTLGRQPGPNGSGHLATVVMRALHPGQSSLELQNTQVTDIMGNTQPLTVEGAVVTVEPGSAFSLAGPVPSWVAIGGIVVLAAVAGLLLRRRRRGHEA